LTRCANHRLDAWGDACLLLLPLVLVEEQDTVSRCDARTASRPTIEPSELSLRQ
jgi:hypothetical protein